MMSSVRQLSWSAFRGLFSGRQPPGRLFRGQASTAWRLQPSLFRLDHRPSLERYLAAVVPEVHSAVCGSLDLILNPSLPHDLSRFLTILRRYDFPSPLLDWTRSPLIAAFFAFDHADATASGRVALWQLDVTASAFETMPVEVVTPHPGDNPTLLAQDGVHLRFLTEQALDAEPTSFDEASPEPLVRFELPASEARVALDDLASLGIHAASLFPGGSDVCQSIEQELALERQRLLRD
jgi:hypothetical protein